MRGEYNCKEVFYASFIHASVFDISFLVMLNDDVDDYITQRRVCPLPVPILLLFVLFHSFALFYAVFIFYFVF